MILLISHISNEKVKHLLKAIFYTVVLLVFSILLSVLIFFISEEEGVSPLFTAVGTFLFVTILGCAYLRR